MFVALSSLVVVAACAAPGAQDSMRGAWASDGSADWHRLWPELAVEGARDVGSEGAFPAVRPDQAGLERLREAERVWRAGDDAAFARERAELAGDPVLSFWLARMLIRDVLFHQGNAAADAAALVVAPPWQRSVDALVAMGESAAPCIVLDLMRQRSAGMRELGADLLNRMGPERLPAWERAFALPDPLVRRYLVEAISGWNTDGGAAAEAAYQRLVEGTRDADFGVRAKAWIGIGRANGEQGPRLRRALAAESDPFVRRAIVEALSHQPDLDSAAAILDFLEVAVRTGDAADKEAGRRAFMRFSGEVEARSVGQWRRWLERRRSQQSARNPEQQRG